MMKYFIKQLLFFALILTIVSCGDIIDGIKNSLKQTELVFKGNQTELLNQVKEKYDAESVSLGISSWSTAEEKDEWIYISIHNAENELDDNDRLELAKLVYSKMDTSQIQSTKIEVKQSSKKGFIITISHSSNQYYNYYELDSNISPPKSTVSLQVDVKAILDSVINNNSNKCKTNFYEALLFSWNGDLVEANKELLKFEACNLDGDLGGCYKDATDFIVLTLIEQDQETIEATLEFLVPQLDSLDYESFSFFKR